MEVCGRYGAGFQDICWDKYLQLINGEEEEDVVVVEEEEEDEVEEGEEDVEEEEDEEEVVKQKEDHSQIMSPFLADTGKGGLCCDVGKIWD